MSSIMDVKKLPGRRQLVRVDGPTLRREVKEEGRTFEGLFDYLGKYHGFKNFVGMGGHKEGQEFVIEIRYPSWWERFWNYVRGK